MVTNLSKNVRLNRRLWLKFAGAASLQFLGAGFYPLVDIPTASAEKSLNSDFKPDIDIALSAVVTEVPILPGKYTRVWAFRGQLIKGDRGSLIQNSRSYLGPTIRVNKGQKVRIRFSNQIPEETIVHWHGLHVPAEMDGHPRHVISSGKTYLYEFKVNNRAGTYWYHPHPHGRTGPQVYYGLAGLFIVSDEEEKKARLPSGPEDIPLVIQDRAFDRDNQLVYLSGHMMERMSGFLGNWILVNGRPGYVLPVADRAYRLRLLNGSNSRIYRLAWQDETPLVIIGTDGGLLPLPVNRPYVFLGPGERIDLWADFTSRTIGSTAMLVSLPFDAGMAGGPPELPNGAGFPVLKMSVARREKSHTVLPATLSDSDGAFRSAAVNSAAVKKFVLEMRHMTGTINGRMFQMTKVADDEVVRLGSSEIWEFINDVRGRGMMSMPLPHPVHLHGKSFKVLYRSGVLHSGYVDEGWKDTVLLMPGERVRIQVPFDDYAGLFLYHCHNLEHEDMGMMRNYFVRG